MMVICDPLPVPDKLPDGMKMADWPTEQKYDVGIKFDNGMMVDRPHIVSFLRMSEVKTKVEFAAKDASGKEVFPKQTVELADLTGGKAQNKDKCKCNGENPRVDTETFGEDYGKSCKAFEADKCDVLWPDVTRGSWCC